MKLRNLILGIAISPLVMMAIVYSSNILLGIIVAIGLLLFIHSIGRN